MPLYELQPKYVCEVMHKWTSCSPSDFCDKKVNWKVDMQSKYSLENWVQAFRMQCASKYEFGLFGSIFFLAVVISSTVFPALSDRIGRRPVCIVGVAI
jgi:hypothetical protein